ncbi:BTAD domain-containing putative transcriptional regulator [Nonomuraea sp. 3N208]|uniref:BTAD domain-containing putative transcriptional regulator n=1 Tax=Nonomuraea sp. 3N208 TaxID=3457421 RepID=UPI003FD0D425
MWIGLLGPLEVRADDGETVEVVGLRLRRLLARLALSSARPVSVEALVEAVWGHEPPGNAANSLQSLITRLRRAVGSSRLSLVSGGYRLALANDRVDVGRFEDLIAEGRAAMAAGELEHARDRLGEACLLWRGQPFADLGTDFATGFAARLHELRLSAIEDRAEARLRLGEPVELEQVAAEHPLRERLQALHMRALVAAGRPADALSAFEDLRRRLAEELGTDPSAEVREVHLSVLRAERPAARTNLRTPLTSFVGRTEEVERLGKLLAGSRLVTLVGPGGAGKTRLATEMAIRVAGRFPGGAWLVELAGIRDPAEVPSAVLAALGRREGGLFHLGSGMSVDPLERVAEVLREQQLLLLLDNCEHLIEACARVAEVLAGTCPRLSVLVTSREPMAITGEVLFPVGPLRTPTQADDALDSPAVRLFVDRAGAVRSGFALSEENTAAVVEICRRLDGLPLAIELACARLRTLPVAEVAARLGDRFRLLTGGSRTALPRHQTLAAVVEWSWELFSETERIAARRLAVFADGATLDAAQAVCAGDGVPGEDVLDLLGALVDKSFLELIETPEPRYRMLDTIRAYAAAALAQSGEAARIRRAHAAHFLTMAETADPALRSSQQLRWMARLEPERANFHTALRWAADDADPQTAVRLLVALGWFWVLRGEHAEAAALSRDILSATGNIARDILAAAYAYDAMNHYAVDDRERANASKATAQELAAGIGSPHPATSMIAMIDLLEGSTIDAARAQLAKLARHDDPWVVAMADLMSGHAAAAAGDAANAAAYLAAARDRFSAIGDRWGVAGAVSSLGTGSSLTGDHATSIAALSETISVHDALGALDDATVTRVELALERLRGGDLENARTDLIRAAADASARRSADLRAFIEVGLGELARRADDPEQSRTLFEGALQTLRDTQGPAVRFRTLALIGLARLRANGGDLRGTRSHLEQALAVSMAPAGDRPLIATVAEACAELKIARGDAAAAARLLGLAAAIRGQPDLGDAQVRKAGNTARAALGDQTYESTYEAAVRLGAEAAVAALAQDWRR